MPFGWLSDPLLEFAANISLVLILVIFLIIAVLAFDQARYLKIRKAQRTAKNLFHQIEEIYPSAPPQTLVTRAQRLKNQMTVYWIGRSYHFAQGERALSYAYFRSFELIYAPQDLYRSRKPEDLPIALELVSLGKLDSEISFVQSHISKPGLSVFACQALMALNPEEGFEASSFAYQKGLITTSDLLRIMSEVTDSELRAAKSSELELFSPIMSPYLRAFR